MKIIIGLCTVTATFMLASGYGTKIGSSEDSYKEFYYGNNQQVQPLKFKNTRSVNFKKEEVKILNVSEESYKLHEEFLALINEGDIKAAEEVSEMLYEEATSEFSSEKHNHNKELALALVYIGEIKKIKGENDLAWKDHEKAFWILNENKVEDQKNNIFLSKYILDTMIKNNKIKEALVYAEEVNKKAINIYGKNSEIEINTKIEVAKIYALTNNELTAINIFRIIEPRLEHKIRNNTIDTNTLSKFYNAKAETESSLNKYEKSIKSIEKSIEYQEKEEFRNNKLAEAYILKADQLQYLERYEESITAYKKSKKIYEEIFEEDNYSTIEVIKKISVSYRKLGDNEKSKEFLNVALEKLEKYNSGKTRAKLRMYVDFSNTYYNEDNKELALEYMKKAYDLEIYLTSKSNMSAKIIKQNVEFLEKEIENEW